MNKSVPILIQKFAQRSVMKMDTVPHCSTVEMMTRKPGVRDLQVAEVLMRNFNLTLGFDATMHIGVQQR